MTVELMLIVFIVGLLVYGIGRFSGYSSGYNRGMDDCEEKYKLTIKELKELILEERGQQSDYYR